MQRTLRRPQRDCIRFCVRNVTEETGGSERRIQSIIGELVITSKQAIKLNLKSHTQISPYLEACCLRMSAVISDKNAAVEVKYLTGIEISKSAQQRLIHRQEFDLPQLASVIEELSADGENIRMRTPTGEPSVWRGYQAICLHDHNAIVASFQENTLVTDWVNEQELAPMITYLGDGHDGVWNIFKEVATSDRRREVLDWYHLMENLHKIAESAALGVSPSAAPFQDRRTNLRSLNKKVGCSHPNISTARCLSIPLVHL